jgi:hypothetical protein
MKLSLLCPDDHREITEYLIAAIQELVEPGSSGVDVPKAMIQAACIFLLGGEIQGFGFAPSLAKGGEGRSVTITPEMREKMRQWLEQNQEDSPNGQG